MYKYINNKNFFTNEIERFILKINNDGSYTTFPAVDDNIHYQELMLKVENGELIIEEAVAEGNTITDNGGNE